MVCFLVNCNVAVLFLDDEFDEGFLDDSWSPLETSGHSHCDHPQFDIISICWMSGIHIDIFLDQL